MKKRMRWVALAAALCVLCSGCSLDVESFLRPPRVQGEQQAIQAALETYMLDSGGVAGRYVLKYPVEGDHTAAFSLCDEAGRPTEEDARMAVAFYSFTATPEEIHINLLRREGDDWVSVADAVGAGVAIRQVAFGDLDGDGSAEIVTGWSTYSNRVHQMVVYDTEGGLRPVEGSRLYTAMYVGDLTAENKDSLLLLHNSGTEHVTATRNYVEAGRLIAAESVRLDGSVEQFGRMTLCRLATGVHGLFVEGYKTSGEMVTELIYYNNKGLCAPFYDPDTNRTAVTTRAGQLAARDIDGDGMVEIPYSRLLGEHADSKVGGTLTVWRAWDYASGQWLDRAHTVVNTEDRYLITLDRERVDTLATAYDTASHTLDLADKETRRVWLRLTVGEYETSAPEENMRSLVLFSEDEGSPACTAWYDPKVLRAEKVRYMVSRLTEQGGGADA